ncbi:hypothetical protein OEZ86_005727 [Tetradesmus obliquus]|nr:hypothetical protein OEZ86_005727 [Tetradesmus obliquus]
MFRPSANGSFAVLVASQDFSGAVKVLDEAIDETRQDYTAAQFRLVQLHLNRGICNQRLHLNRKALKDYDAVLALMPSNVNALLRKGQVLQSMGKQAEARVVWEAATSLADPASDLEVQQMATNSVALQIAINQINGGQVEQAEALLDSILASNPSDLSALVARGTARALARKLKEAVADFTKAIEIEPRYPDTHKNAAGHTVTMMYPDTYKRRGQARSALGDVQGALTDLEKAAQLLAELPGGAADAAGGPADCHAERGMLFHKQRDYRRAVKELAKATELDPSNAQAWNYLGLGRVSMGDIREGCKAYEKAIELAPQMKEAWLNLGQALKEEGRVKEAERALTKAMTSADGGACLAAYRLLATMRQGQGRQADAIKVLDKALGFKREDQRVELLYMRAICYHALGYARAALADYEACMNCKPRVDEGPAGEESRMFQFLSFYQREMALFTAHSLDRRAADFCLDSELTPLFKECWCKKGAPSPELFTSYKMQPALPAERSSGSGRGSSSGAEGGADAEQVAALTAAADVIGQLLQNHHQGFLPNVRQQRAAGYAAAELAQAVRALLAERAAGREGLWVNSEGASGQGGCSGRHLFGWRDAMDIVVKWRQLAEPADQVVWVDLLTPREFEAGFGSHTPMFSGQTKCVRYFMNFNRALELAKECLLEVRE